MALLPQAVADAVRNDGLARVVTADDGSCHVLFLDGQQVRSMLCGDWVGPLPTDPTPSQIAAAIQARAAQAQQDAADAAALRQRVISLAQSAVGVQIDQLTAVQVRALIAVLLHKAGALTPTGNVKPLSEWD